MASILIDEQSFVFTMQFAKKRVSGPVQHLKLQGKSLSQERNQQSHHRDNRSYQ